MSHSMKHMVVVSNRLPVAIYQDEQEEWHLKLSPGGLVTALSPIIRQSGGLWIGWPGCSSEAPAERLLHEYNASLEYQLLPVSISDKENALYYRGFSNKTIWPLFHDLIGQFSFSLENWHIYQEVNRRFADVTARNIHDDSFVWIHDYQLIYVGHFLREAGVKQNLNFFLHIPFPALDVFRRLPRNKDILHALLAYDHVGFQTPADRRNFIQCIKWLIPEAKWVERKRQSIIRLEGREILLGYYPISIDFNEFNKLAHSKEVEEAAWYLRENITTKTIVLGLDRLDYTKGIPERVLAFERMLEKYPETIGEVSLVQVVVPSRLNVPEYQALKTTLDGLVGRINARYTKQGWVPIYYQFRELDRVQLLAHYKNSDVALITPLRDGMNLVSKEFCASSIDNNGVLILSEFAGAAAQLAKGALMVNPFDIEGTADAIHEAILMPLEERQRRMKILRAEVKRNDVKRWVEWFLEPHRAALPPAMELPESTVTSEG